MMIILLWKGKHITLWVIDKMSNSTFIDSDINLAVKAWVLILTSGVFAIFITYICCSQLNKCYQTHKLKKAKRFTKRRASTIRRVPSIYESLGAHTPIDTHNSAPGRLPWHGEQKIPHAEYDDADSSDFSGSP